KDKIEVTTSWSLPPVNEEKRLFDLNKTGLAEFHKHMVNIRKSNLDSDKVQLFTEDDVLWKDVASVIDAIKNRLPGDPVFTPKNGTDTERAMAAEYVFPKVIM